MGLGGASALLAKLSGKSGKSGKSGSLAKALGSVPTTVRMPLKGELLEEQARLLSAMKAETFVRAHFLQEWGKPKYSLSSAVRLFLSHSMHREIPAHPLRVSLLVL